MTEESEVVSSLGLAARLNVPHAIIKKYGDLGCPSTIMVRPAAPGGFRSRLQVYNLAEVSAWLTANADLVRTIHDAEGIASVAGASPPDTPALAEVAAPVSEAANAPSVPAAIVSVATPGSLELRCIAKWKADPAIRAEFGSIHTLIAYERAHANGRINHRSSALSGK